MVYIPIVPLKKLLVTIAELKLKGDNSYISFTSLLHF